MLVFLFILKFLIVAEYYQRLPVDRILVRQCIWSMAIFNGIALFLIVYAITIHSSEYRDMSMEIIISEAMWISTIVLLLEVSSLLFVSGLVATVKNLPPLRRSNKLLLTKHISLFIGLIIYGLGISIYLSLT